MPVLAVGLSGGDESCQETLPMAAVAGTVSGYGEAMVCLYAAASGRHYYGKK